MGLNEPLESPRSNKIVDEALDIDQTAHSNKNVSSILNPNNNKNKRKPIILEEPED
jgi:hypothetical protein